MTDPQILLDYEAHGLAIAERPVTTPDLAIHLCPGPQVPADLTAYLARRVGNTRLPCWAAPPYSERLSVGGEYRALVLLDWLAPCWAMGLAPARDAVLSLFARMDLSIDAAISPLGVFAHRDALAKWIVPLNDLVRFGVVVERQAPKETPCSPTSPASSPPPAAATTAT